MGSLVNFSSRDCDEAGRFLKSIGQYDAKAETALKAIKTWSSEGRSEGIQSYVLSTIEPLAVWNNTIKKSEFINLESRTRDYFESIKEILLEQ